jgi:hypothetical protein
MQIRIRENGHSFPAFTSFNQNTMAGGLADKARGYRVTDGSFTLEGGIDSGRSPALIASNKLAFAVNTTFRGGFAKTRPPFVKTRIQWPSGVQSLSFQGLTYYNVLGQTPMLVLCASGRQFTINPQSGSVREITPGLFFQGNDGAISGMGLVVTTNQMVGITLNQLNGDTVWIGGVYGKISSNTATTGGGTTTFTVVSWSGINPSGTGNTFTIFQPPISNPLQPLVWMLQAERFLVIQDGLEPPIFFDGAVAWRSIPSGIGNPNTDPSLPTGTAMAYVQGRIWVAQGQSYVAGDIVYNQQSGTSEYNFSDSILYMTENNFLNGGGSFSVPSGAGPITSMASLPTIDTALGQGPLAIFTATTIFSNNAPTDRTQWQNLSYPIQVVAQVGFGGVGFFSTVPINGDLFYRSAIGTQSFRVAQRRFVDSWGNTPMSREVKRILDQDQQSLLPYASAVFFDNRYLLLCTPTYVPGSGVSFPGIIPLDFDILGSMDQLFNPANHSPPAYDGLWTGLNWLRLTNGNFLGVDRCFGAVLNSSNQIEIWEVLPTLTSQTEDQYIIETSPHYFVGSPIEWTFETKRYNFSDGSNLKRVSQIELWLEQIIGTVTVQWYWRPDNDPQWYSWGSSKSLCATIDLCPLTCPPIPLGQHGSAPRLIFPAPPSTNCVCSATTGNPADLGYMFQYRAVITGSCRIEQMRFSATPQTDAVGGTCDNASPQCVTVNFCDPSEYDYQIPDPY